MNHYIKSIQEKIEPLRQQIINHKVYSVINDLDDLKVFMQYHVYAVWDFMSLLKSLQSNLTCTSVPWFPVGSAPFDSRNIDITCFGFRFDFISRFYIIDINFHCGIIVSSFGVFVSIIRIVRIIIECHIEFLHF